MTPRKDEGSWNRGGIGRRFGLKIRLEKSSEGSTPFDSTKLQFNKTGGDIQMSADVQSKDWIGNHKSVYSTLGASNHTDKERASHDYYATDPKAMELLLREEQFSDTVWECACGEGHLSKVLSEHGYEVISTDLIYRGFGSSEPIDFLSETATRFGGGCDIITNPPYKHALEFVEQAIDVVRPGGKVAMFLKLQFLEGKSRKQFFLHNPPKVVYVSSSRLVCALNGEFDKTVSSAVAYAWFVWEKGFQGNSIIKWIN